MSDEPAILTGLYGNITEDHFLKGLAAMLEHNNKDNKEFHWVYVVRWHHSGHIWKIFDTVEKAKNWVEQNSNHNIYWSAWNVE